MNIEISATRALECLDEDRIALFPEDGYPEMIVAYDRRHIPFWKQAIARSQKFLAGELTEIPATDCDPEVLHLPYDEIYIEATLEGFTPTKADRLILLCSAHPTKIWEDNHEPDDRYCFCVRPLAYTARAEKFNDQPAVVDPLFMAVVSVNRDEDIHVSIFKLTEGRHEVGKAEKDAFKVMVEAVHKLMDFLTIINCTNIGFKEIEAPPKLNAARKKKGRRPFFNYKTLYIKQRGIYRSKAEEDSERHHASPCLHWRRGHVRKLESGRRVWVRAAIVGDPARGVTIKDYKRKI